MHFDELYQYTGQIGVYQICVLVVLFAFDLFALDSTTMIFVGADMPHWCRVERLANFSYDRQKYIGIPYIAGDSQGQLQPDNYDSCKMYALNYSEYSDDELYNWNRTLMIDESIPVMECTQWVYEQTIFVSTIVSKFDLVCELSLLVELVSAVYMTGSLAASFMSGYVADRFGRKLGLMVFLAIKMVGICMSTLAPNYIVFIIGRFILAMGSVSVYLTSYIFMMESIGPDYRALVGCCLQISTSVGFMLQPIIASSVRDHTLFQLAYMTPIAIFFSMAFFLEESLRWLVVKRRYSLAYDSLRRICSINNKHLPPEIDLTSITNDEKTASCTVLMTLPRLRLRTIVLHILNFVSSFLWFSLALNTGNLQGDMFINTIISAALEIPSIILTIFLLQVRFLGRRINCSASFMLTGLTCLSCIPTMLFGFDSVVTGLAIFAKSVSTASYTIVFIWTSELFPTEVRNSAMGSTMMMACIANIISPYVGEPLSIVWGPLPYVILGSSAVVAGVLSLLLPETLGQPLPDTALQAESFTGKSTASDVTTVADDHDNEAYDKDVSDERLSPAQTDQQHSTRHNEQSNDITGLNNGMKLSSDSCRPTAVETKVDSHTIITSYF